jgi:gliding motility-associated-like protein
LYADPVENKVFLLTANSMKPLSVTSVITFVLTLFFSFSTKAQNFGTSASAIWVSDCNQSNFYNTSGSGSLLIGPVANSFDNNNFGTHTQNSGTLILRGAQVKTFKTPGLANVCSVRMHYRIYPQSGAPGSFSIMDLPWMEDCGGTGSFSSGSSCAPGDQIWNRVVPDGTTTPYAPVNLTNFSVGNYVLEVYYDVSGSSTSTTLCDETVTLNNGGNNYKAYFSIQAPNLSSLNPTTCNGSEGAVTISGLTPGTSYSVTYSDDGTAMGPITIVANAAGQAAITGLNAGVYSDIIIITNGCSTQLNTGIILSNPVYTPTFTPIPPFCAGTTPPVLPTVSNNGISGTWSPSTVSNTASGTYTFTPTPGQCGITISRNIVVTPRTTPTFSFGTSLTICTGGVVPALPTTSTNGISGTWNPSVVSNTASGTYTFTPNGGACANPATVTVTVNPNIPPTFSFGNALTICAGGSVPALPTTSTNGITGTWNPSTVNNNASGTYTFTPAAGQCAVPATFNVTVNPNTIPTFSFGNTLNICSGGSVPALPGTSNNGVTGTWSPSVVSNTASGTYTFTPTAGICALPFTLNVTVNPNIVPTFSFGTSLTICAGGIVPTLPMNSTNGITGSWSPSSVDNQNSGIYTFTPDPGQCATSATFTVTVTPNITPTFNFGSTLTVCAGAGVPSLPTTSTNGISGTWNPATVSNSTSGTYTFTPNAGVCAIPVTFNVTVNPNLTPVFSFGTSLTICSGAAVPSLPATSNNGVNGTWSPSTVSNTTSGTYTFTPSGGQCAVPVTFTVNVTPNITPTFTFGTSLTICANGAVPSLPTTSTNGITGSWSPATVDNQNSDTYTFTPDAGQCALPTTFTVTVNPNIVPTFTFGTTATVCSGATVPTLPTTSNNGITGTWSPSTVSNTASGTYTFTPTAGLCATTTTFTVTVNPNVTPVFSFGTSLTICAGSGVPALPTTSSNGVSGTWSPSTVSNQNSGVYTFTPGGGCALPVTFTVTVTPNIVPTFTFGTSLNICAGGTVPSLPNNSTNGITGTWTPAVVDNTTSGSYTFTPDAGICAVPVTFNVTVNPIVTPAFNFGTTLTICAGSSVPSLPTTSTNGVSGTWTPATVDNQSSGVYTFTPTAGQCANPTSFTVTVNPNTIPTFSFGPSLTICAGSAVPSLPNISDNGINGTWSPAIVDNQNSGVYIFTPAAGVCALPYTYTVTVNPIVTPSFSFGTSMSVCNGGTVPVLTNTSNNGITGTWSPATVDNTTSGTYTFTPAAGQCAVPTTFDVTVNPNVTPVFSFGTTLTICAGAGVPSLPTTSTNGITGTWNPAVPNDLASGVYTFTPSAGQCATPTTFTVTVNQNTVPTFSIGTGAVMCAGATVPTLPLLSNNGISGDWSPSVINNQTSGVYTFTPTPVAGQCLAPASFIMTINPILAPSFTFGNSLTLCAGSTAPLLPATSANGITGTWSPSVISNQNSGTYTFTSDPGQCATATATLNVTITPLATFSSNAVSDTTVTDGAIVPANIVNGTPAGATFVWTNSNPAIGLSASGTGNVPSFTATNLGTSPISGTITVTPMNNGCAGAARTYTITIKPLNKDIWVPNVFSPNGDGKNDLLFVYGNYISRVDMRIFNQWGEQVDRITDKNKGWDGRHQGKPQPVGVYVYTLQAVLTDGRTIQLTGNVTLLR